MLFQDSNGSYAKVIVDFTMGGSYESVDLDDYVGDVKYGTTGFTEGDAERKCHR